MISEYLKKNKGTGHFKEKRKEQNKHWLHETIEDRLRSDFYGSKAVDAEIAELERRVLAGELSPFRAGELLIGKFKRKV